MTEICTHAVYFREKSQAKATPLGKRVHFAYVMLKVRNKFILFLLALLPLLFEGSGKAEQILITVLLQTLAFAAVFIPALISRNCTRWDFDGKYIFLSSGIFSKKQTAISADKISRAHISKTLFLSLFKAVRLEMRSSNGNKKSEITLYLSPDEANALVSKILKPTCALCTLTPRTAPFLLMSASRANFAVGLSLLAAFIISFSSAANVDLPEKIYSGISETSALILPYLPPITAVLAACFFLGWLVHFLKICFSDARQVTTVSSQCIITVKGLISTHLYCIRKSDISSCETRQTVLSMIFKQGSVGITSIGQNRNAQQYVLSAWDEPDCQNVCRDLTSASTKPDITVKVSENARLVWWLPYLLSAVFIGILWIRLFFLRPAWFDTFSFFALISAALLVWKCSVGIIGSEKAKIEFSGQYVCMSSVRAFSFYTQKVFFGKTALFRITQTVLQRPRNLCTVYIKATGTSRGLRCRNLPYDMLLSLSERIK